MKSKCNAHVTSEPEIILKHHKKWSIQLHQQDAASEFPAKSVMRVWLHQYVDCCIERTYQANTDQLINYVATFFSNNKQQGVFAYKAANDILVTKTEKKMHVYKVYILLNFASISMNLL